MPPKQCVCLLLWIACKTVVERPPSSANREIDALANFKRPLCGRFSFTKAKHARLDQEKIFPTIDWVWKSTEKMTPQCPFKVTGGDRYGNRSTGPWTQATLIFGLFCFAATTIKMTTGQVVAASQSIHSSPRVRQSSPQVRKSLVLCKEKTLRDKVGVIVIIDTRANCIASKKGQKAERKCWNWALKTRPPKHGNFVTFLCFAKGAGVDHCACQKPSFGGQWFIPRARIQIRMAAFRNRLQYVALESKKFQDFCRALLSSHCWEVLQSIKPLVTVVVQWWTWIFLFCFPFLCVSLNKELS